jgi:hypothetical protein
VPKSTATDMRPSVATACAKPGAGVPASYIVDGRSEPPKVMAPNGDAGGPSESSDAGGGLMAGFGAHAGVGWNSAGSGCMPGCAATGSLGSCGGGRAFCISALPPSLSLLLPLQQLIILRELGKR